MLPQSEVFEKAAQLIEEKGWLNSTTPLESDCHCLWTATCYAASMYGRVGTVGQSTKILADHFGVTKSIDIFHLNDSHDEQWAINQLREISAKLKGVENVPN